MKRSSIFAKPPVRQHALALPAQVLVLLALLMLGLLGFSALAVDVAFAYAERHLLQNAVDAPALGGTSCLPRPI